MIEYLLFGFILAGGVTAFFLLKSRQGKKQAQATQNYDDKIDRVVDQFDNL